MKPILFFLFTVLLIPFSTDAQKPTFGFKAGLNMGKWKLGDPTTSFENKFRVGLLTGFNANVL
jgi:hypothetical protein